MKKILKKSITISLITGFFLAASNIAAGITTVDFEDLPDTYYYFGSRQNLDGYYAGLNFGPNATILDRVIYGYNDSGYPPHSGNAVLFNDDPLPVRVDFVGSTANYVEAWYTSINPFYLEAYDASNNLLASSSGPDNYTTNSLISVSAPNIAYVKFPSPGYSYTLDDFGYETGAVIPAPGAILLGSIGVGLVGWLRRRRTL